MDNHLLSHAIAIATEPTKDKKTNTDRNICIIPSA